MKKSVVLVLLLAFVGFGIVWFLSPPRPDAKNDSLLIPLEGNPVSVDPTSVLDVHSSMVATAIHSPLAWIAQDGKAVPMVAQKLELSADAKLLTITVKSGQLFWDDSPVTAGDVRYSLERYRRSGHPHRWILDRVAGVADFDEKKVDSISGISVLSPVGIEIRFLQPEPDAVFMLSNLGVAIVKIGTGEQPAKPFGLHVIGCGPFAPQEFSPGNFVCKLRRDSPDSPKQLQFRSIPDDQARLDAFKNHSADILRLRGPLIGEALISANGVLQPRSDIKRGEVTIYPANELNYLMFNWSSPKFANVSDEQKRSLIEEASKGIDRAKLVSSLYPNGTAEATASIAPPLTGAEPIGSIPSSGMAFPYPGRLTLLAANDSASRLLAVAIQRQLAQAGIEWETEFVDLAKLVERLVKKDYDVELMWMELQIASTGPYGWLSFFDEKAALSAFGEPRSDTGVLLAQARGELDPVARAAAYRDIVRLVNERQRSWIPLLSRKAVVLHDRSVIPFFDVNATPVNGLLRLR